MRRRFYRLTRRSIKESFDNLPSGICYFNKEGIPVLCNHRMDRLAYEMMGRDLQWEAELMEALSKLQDDTLTDSEGRSWLFTKAQVQSEGIGYTEYLAVEVTRLNQETEALWARNAELKKMVEITKEINRNVSLIAREEEILSMKMRIHGEMGRSVMELRRYHREQQGPEARQQLVQHLNETIGLLKNEVGQSDRIDDLEELLETANAIGARIRIEGSLPQEAVPRELTISAMRECLTNAITHAGGDVLWVKVQKFPQAYRVELTNNGVAPEQTVVEGGGLSSLRKKIERTGGTMTILSRPDFRLILTIAKEGGRIL